MNSSTARRTQSSQLPLSEGEVLQLGREVICAEARALAGLVGQLDSSFFHAVGLLYRLRGNLIVTGMGKAGLIGNKLTATFASTVDSSTPRAIRTATSSLTGPGSSRRPADTPNQSCFVRFR